MEFIDGIPVYMVDGLDSEVTAISLVSEPAIMESFVTFNKDKKNKMEMFMNNEKMQVMGPVLIPDQKIYRNNDGYEYYIVFSQNAIEQLSRKFLTELRNNQWSIQHEEETSSVSIVESWIKSGSDDKSNMFGFNMPVGTWMVTAQINDIDLWQKIKRGDMTGFSIEAWLNLDEIITDNFNKMEGKEQKMAKFVETLKQFISEFLESEEPATNEVEPKEEKVEEETSEPETNEEENVEVEIPEPAEDNELVVEEAPESIEPEPEPEQENLSSVIAELEAKLKELEDENSSLQDKVENLSKQPSAEPVNVNANKQNMRDYLREIANKF